MLIRCAGDVCGYGFLAFFAAMLIRSGDEKHRRANGPSDAWLTDNAVVRRLATIKSDPKEIVLKWNKYTKQQVKYDSHVGLVSVHGWSSQVLAAKLVLRCQEYPRSYGLAATNERVKGEVIAADSGTMSEASLVAALKAGDKGAAEILVRTHASWMLAVARRVAGDSALAEDCVQEAFINVFRKIGAFEERSSLKTWLHRIVVNQVLMKLRARRNKNETPIDELLPAFDGNACRIEEPWQRLATPEEIFEREDRRALIHSKINELPESYRIILQLRDIEELTTREVAEALDLSEANVKVRLHRARSALKKLLEPLLKGEL